MRSWIKSRALALMSNHTGGGLAPTSDPMLVLGK